MTNAKKEKERRPAAALLLDLLRNRFQTREFSTANAIKEVKRIAGYSPAKAGRILRKGLETKELTRLREGRYVFTTRERIITEKQRSKLKTLQNNILYLNFKAKLERLNPARDIEQLYTSSCESCLEIVNQMQPESVIGCLEPVAL